MKRPQNLELGCFKDSIQIFLSSIVLQNQLNENRSILSASNQGERINRYSVNDQLEELRNLQDRFQEEKTVWLKQKEAQEKELEEQKYTQKLLQVCIS
jgi:septum formation inhibitor-activating ATPase MinD